MGDVPDTYNFADVWEAVVPRVAERTALVCGDRRLTYAELDDRATALARWMRARGVGPGDHVGLYLINTPAYVEAFLACFKLRAVPINVNFRYVAGELAALLDDAAVVGVLHNGEFADRVAAIRDDLPAVTWWLDVDDEDSYEGALAAGVGDEPFGPRSDDDHYVIYTGGTTGRPKGVVWRHEDAFFACLGGGDPSRLHGPVTCPADVVDRINEHPLVFFPSAPLMHAAGQWTTLSWLYAGGTIVLVPGSFDGATIWRTIEREGVNVITVTGDATVRPLVDAWDEHGPFDVSSLFSVGSGGAPLTPALKARLRAVVPNCVIADGFGSSETGAQGSNRLGPGDDHQSAIVFTSMGGDTAVLDPDTRRPVVPGDGVVGRVARRGHIPLGYHRDPEGTAQRFVTIDGERWVITGDHATVGEDGSIVLLGRGSSCINTGGEKVHPEEVEAALKASADVYDCIVVGVPDDRWGQAVAAVVQPSPGVEVDAERLRVHCRELLAGYKVPKSFTFVDRVERSPAGKPDLRWAASLATATAAS